MNRHLILIINKTSPSVKITKKPCKPTIYKAFSLKNTQQSICFKPRQKYVNDIVPKAHSIGQRIVGDGVCIAKRLMRPPQYFLIKPLSVSQKSVFLSNLNQLKPIMYMVFPFDEDLYLKALANNQIMWRKHALTKMAERGIFTPRSFRCLE